VPTPSNVSLHWTLPKPANTLKAAIERVPEIKPEDVQEVFFGNVLSAKYVP
jgi:hypothetical protein